MTDTLLSELAALEQSTDPEKREVGARLRTAIRNVLLEVMQEEVCAHTNVVGSMWDDQVHCVCGKVWDTWDAYRKLRPTI